MFVCSSSPPNPNELKFRGIISLGCRLILAKDIRNRPTVSRKTYHVLEGSSGYSYFSSVVGVNAVKDNYNFVLAQLLVKNKGERRVYEIII